ncbi:PREDICTED: attractin-like, partial [Tauraco erythrolophus]|uniref:attractin-like n=1 Tax=Tauraco erythrolophus TaxID=121530 RepID=UPI000523C22F
MADVEMEAMIFAATPSLGEFGSMLDSFKLCRPAAPEHPQPLLPLKDAHDGVIFWIDPDVGAGYQLLLQVLKDVQREGNRAGNKEQTPRAGITKDHTCLVLTSLNLMFSAYEDFYGYYVIRTSGILESSFLNSIFIKGYGDESSIQEVIKDFVKSHIQNGLTGPSGYVTDGPGNYKYKTKCTWLIEGRPNTILRLRFNHFATECSWDHLYVYDGDSIYAPLLAAFSGLIVPEKDSNETVPEVVATSGYALLHFFSDAAYNLTGFNITYNFNMCPNNCSGRGECKLKNSSDALECECAKYWKGEACDIPYCTDDCGAPERGHCSFNDTKTCLCSAGWQGPGCSVPVPANQSFWTREEYSLPKLPRASHKTIIHDNKMWIVGGYVFNHSDSQKVLAYDLISEEWLPLANTVNSVEMRYGHSLALHEDDIYMYGGKIDATGNVTSQLWVFHIPTQTWTQATPEAKERYAVVGHSAHIVTLQDGSAVMLVIFGHCPLYGYISNVQEYNVATNKWNILQTSGALVQGGYGHSSVYDPNTRSIYIHGGYKAFSANKYRLADDLYKYEVDSRMWTILKDSRFFRYLHTAVIMSGTMLVFGGNTHNDTSMSHGAKCFSSDFMAYDIACDRWSVLPRPGLHHDVNRFGHSAVLYN